MPKSILSFDRKDQSKAEYHEVLLYALKDVTSDSFGTIFEARSDDAAKRSISQHCSLEPTTMFAMYPQDYQLWRLGNFDRNTGVLLSGPEYLCAVAAITPPSKS